MTSNQITFRVPDMSCAHCVQTITQAIVEAIEGTHVEADLERHLVTVTGTNEIGKITALLAERDYAAEAL